MTMPSPARLTRGRFGSTVWRTTRCATYPRTAAAAISASVRSSQRLTSARREPPARANRRRAHRRDRDHSAREGLVEHERDDRTCQRATEHDREKLTHGETLQQIG